MTLTFNHPLTQRFHQTWAQRKEPVTLLLSGGGDSTALLCLLLDIGQPFHCLHFRHNRHGLATSFAIESEQFCRHLCHQHDLKLHIIDINPDALMLKGDLSWEAAARRLRYDALKESSPGIFLTAHTADDQAETVLMRLFDGSGLSGLAGIRAQRRDGILRPVLTFRRIELRHYLADLGQSFVEDPTNQDGNDRARLRNQVLVNLEIFAPHLVSTLCRTAQRLAQDEEALTKLAQDWLDSYGQEDHWDLSALQKLMQALRLRVIRQIWRKTAGPAHRPLAGLFDECERLIMQGGDNRHVLLAQGHALRRTGQRLWLVPPLSDKHWSIALPHALQALNRSPGWRLLPQAPQDCRFAIPLPAGAGLPGSSYSLRSRRPGDRFQGRDLKKLLAALDQPPWVRARWPLLLKDQHIIAIPGLNHLSAPYIPGQYWLQAVPMELRFHTPLKNPRIDD